MSKNGIFDISVSEDIGEKDTIGETEVRAETSGNETEQDHSGYLDEYDPSLNIPTALRKGTRSYMKHPICNFVSYESLSP